MDKNIDENRLVRKTKKVRSRWLTKFSKYKRKLLKHVWALRLLILSAVVGVIILCLFMVILLINMLGFGRYTNLLFNFIFTPTDKVETIGDRTNILILGKGGVGHEAPDLTDTIIFASISHTGEGLVLVSVPRDVWIPALRAKINSAYYWGNQKIPGGGDILAKASVEEVLGQPIQHVMTIDMNDFSKLIDVLGGVEVDVENSFVDEKFPIEGREDELCDGDLQLKCRYETISFEQGLQSMDGETALKFIRSRNAQGDQGTDFARSERQEQVINAIEKKAMSRDVVLSLDKARTLLDLFYEIVDTDLSEDALAILARKLYDSRNLRQSYVLDEQFLENPPISREYDNLYVFIPKSNEGDWREVHTWLKDILNTEE